jgi:hypothetical protein
MLCMASTVEQALRSELRNLEAHRRSMRAHPEDAEAIACQVRRSENIVKALLEVSDEPELVGSGRRNHSRRLHRARLGEHDTHDVPHRASL